MISGNSMNVKRAALAFDALLAGLFSADGGGLLLSFLFHGLFENTAEMMRQDVVHPQQGITVAMFSHFIAYFQKRGYQFVSPDQILAGLPTDGRYMLISFDDGYFNNARALSVLEEFGIPAVFFISSDHVKREKSFWWDVVFRETRKRHNDVVDMNRAITRYKRLKTTAIEGILRQQFGDDALRPIGDLDRPFSPRELRELAKHPLVFLGNHTEDHAILTNYSATEIQAQIVGCQKAIREMTGTTPRMIAYPNGNASQDVYDATQAAGLHLAVGIRPGQNYLPLRSDPRGALVLRRYTLWGNRSIDAQCLVSQSRVSFYRMLGEIRSKTSYRSTDRAA